MALTDVGQLMPGKYLEADDLRGRPVTYVIASVGHEVLTQSDGTELNAPVIVFERVKKAFVATAKTNLRSIALLLGRNPSTWAGKRITLHVDKVGLGTDPSAPCLRVAGSPDATPERVAAFRAAMLMKPRQRPLALKRAYCKLEPLSMMNVDEVKEVEV